LLVLGECQHKNASSLYAEGYPDRHPNPQQFINIERKFHQNPLQQWRQ